MSGWGLDRESSPLAPTKNNVPGKEVVWCAPDSTPLPLRRT